MQRVLLCQFIDTGAVNVTHSATTPTRVAQCGSSHPTVFHVEKYFRQVFTKYLLSLSCLYALRGSSVKVPLDTMYSSLVHEYTRHQMWETIRRDAEALQQQLMCAEHKFDTMKKILQAIYKQHGLPPLTHSLVLADIKRKSNKKYVMDNHNNGSFMNAIHMESNDECVSECVSEEEEEEEDKKCVLGEDDEGYECDEDIVDVNEYVSECVSEEDYEHVGGAITKCLVEAAAVAEQAQAKCSVELTHRRSCRVEGTLEALHTAYDRRTALLLYIINNPISRISSLTRSFVTTFNDVVPVMLSPSKPRDHTRHSTTSPLMSRSPTVTTPSSPTRTSTATTTLDHRSTAVTSTPTSWISRWMSKDPTTTPTTVTPKSDTTHTHTHSHTISRWISIAAPVVSKPEKPRFPLVSSEVVLFYCSCWQSYSMQNDSTGAGGYLYLTEHYIGLVCRSVVGLTKRKELFSLCHLRDVSIWKASSATSSAARGARSSSNVSGECTTVRVPQEHSHSHSEDVDVDTPLSGTTGGILATLATATGLSFLTSGCKLSFEITPRIDDASECVSECVSEGVSESMTIDVFIIPCSGVSVDKLRTLLLEARDCLHPACVHRRSIAQEVQQAMGE
jgi:hypothetical protein